MLVYTEPLMHILVLEDEPKSARHLAEGLHSAGYEVTLVADAPAAETHCARTPFDALIVDVMLPGMSGLEFVHRLRKTGVTTPVLFLSAKGTPEDRTQGLNEGGDDYLVKPYALLELLARLRAILRRGIFQLALPDKVVVADLEWDPAQRRITRGKQRIDLTPHEYALAEFLLQHMGEVVSREQVARAVWGLTSLTDPNALDQQIRRLRKKIDESFSTKLIHTLRGVGVILEVRESE